MVTGGIVSNRLKRKFKKYSKIPLTNGMTGKVVAEKMLEDHGIKGVKVVSVSGRLTDHYNPKDKTITKIKKTYFGAFDVIEKILLLSIKPNI